LVEAGGTLMAAFLREALADELVVFYAPMLTGGDDLGFGELTPEVDLEEQQFTRIGSDIMLRATIKKTNSPQLAYPESLHKM
jgi:diaminohydroxyphosphoribosylaminopyrimidine deaminase/5-amino-6-(5-phosphoribosylamino)uracil reductase